MAVKKPKESPGLDLPDEAARANPEFQKFEEALKRIVKVPKAEVDRLIAESKASRPSRRRSSNQSP